MVPFLPFSYFLFFVFLADSAVDNFHHSPNHTPWEVDVEGPTLGIEADEEDVA